MTSPRVLAVRTYPRRGEAAVEHRTASVGPAGIDGDRTKRAALSLVGRDRPRTRANLVLDVPTADLETLDGEVVRVGGAVLALRRTGNDCPGLYAAVGQGGPVAVGDVLEVLPGTDA